MNSLISQFFAFLMFSFLGTSLCYSQNALAYDMAFEIKRVYPSFSIDRNQLDQANTLVELHKIYKEDWVDRYHSVEISTRIDGQLVKKIGQTNLLTPEQKDIMSRADNGSEISVLVKYLPKNNLSSNVEREMSFKFKIDPEKGARFSKGDQELREYLKAVSIHFWF